jgi:hypothetical protein
MECIAEADLFDLANARRRLGDAPGLEAHLADCAACSALLGTLIGEQVRDARRDLAGRTLGPYRLDGLIGAGAMGEVYRGWDLRLHRHVAVKALSAQFAESPDRVRRLEAEGRAAAAIAHPNVVTVYDSGTADGVPFVVSELITGESLRSVIDRGPIARRTALGLALQLARGLAAAHAKNVVHRDLKPGNLIVTGDGVLKILDFGLAKLTGDRDAEATEPGTLVGTSGYLSPEQARGEPADARSDLFALGAILHELLTGRRAFDGATFAERLSATLRDTPDPIADPAGPIVTRCLEKDPRKRFQSATDLAWALEGVVEGVIEGVIEADAPPPAAPRKLVSRRAMLIGAAATGLGGVLLGRALAPARRAFVPKYRQLTFRQGRVASARFTSDGGTLVYSAAWEDHPLAIFTSRLGGGGTRPLDVPSAQLLAVSSRGQLALSLNHRFIAGFHQHGQLALAPLEGGQPRGLGLEVQHADFTPDGSALAIVRRVDDRFRLELPVGRVLLEAGWLSHPRVSPDGRFVACFVHAGPGDDGGDVVIVPRAGGPARTVAARWSSIDGLAWVRGGNALWVSASREGGNNAVLAIALDGRELASVPAAGRLRVHDLTADGRMAVTHVSGRLRMMVKAPGAETEVDLGLSDVSLLGDLSRDGQTVVFSELGDVDTANGAYLRPSGGAPAVRLGAATPLDLAADGRGVLATQWTVARTLTVFPVPDGQPRSIAVPGLSAVTLARWCSDGRILVGGAVAGRPARLWRLDPDHRLTPITSEGVFDVTMVSPDGRNAALVAGGRLLVIDIERGTPHVVPGTFADESVCGWYTGGRDVFVRSKSPPIRVRRVTVASGASTPVLEIAPPRVGLRGVTTLVMSEDGTAHAYSYGQELSRLYTMSTEDPES